MGHAEFTLHDQPAARRISLDEYWMPFTPNRDFKRDPKMVVRAEGMYFWNDRGDRILDGAAGLFCVAAGPRPQGDRRRGRAPVARTRLRRAVHARPPEAVRVRHARGGTHARRPEPHLLHQFRVGSGRHRDEDRARVSPGARPVRAHDVRVARTRLSRRELRRRRARGHGEQPAQVRTDAAGHRAHAAHARAGESLHAGRRRARRGTGGGPRALRGPVRRREHRRVRRGADRRLDRLPGAAERLPAAPARDLRPARDPARVRRGDHRRRPHRPELRRAELRRDARPHDDGEGADQRRAADGRGGRLRAHPRRHHGRGARGRDRVLPRLHVFRTPGRLRGGHRDARPLPRRKACSSAAARCRPVSSTRSSR